jgi:hypothetical protein
VRDHFDPGTAIVGEAFHRVVLIPRGSAFFTELEDHVVFRAKRRWRQRDAAKDND